jgi:chromate transporter
MTQQEKSLTSPPLAHFFYLWLKLGLQSFGGGATTLLLMRRMAVEEGWLSEVEFTRNWGLVQMSPGINLLGLTILIGRRSLGVKGIVLALAGLLLPSVTLAILFTAIYVHIREASVVEAALRGVIPATVGLGLLTAVQIARPLFRVSWSEGKGSFLLSCLLFIGSGIAVQWWHCPVVLVLGIAGSISALANWRQSRLDSVANSK